MREARLVPSETRQLKTLLTVKCNKCGKECDTSPNINAVHVKHRFEYGSPLDGDIIDFDLCERCVVEYMLTFKIPPKIITLNPNAYGYDVNDMKLALDEREY